MNLLIKCNFSTDHIIIQSIVERKQNGKWCKYMLTFKPDCFLYMSWTGLNPIIAQRQNSLPAVLCQKNIFLDQYKRWNRLNDVFAYGDAISPDQTILWCRQTIIIGPKSDHWEYLSVTHSLTHSCLVNLIDVTLACEDANSKLVEAVSVADVDAEDHVGNSLLQICGLRFDHKAKFWDFELKSGNILKRKFRYYFAADIS